MSDVFISYSRPDSEKADRLYHELVKHGLNVFVDVNTLSAGESFGDRISEEIKSAGAVVLLLSKHSRKSSFVEYELRVALESGNHIRVIPVLLDQEAKQNLLWPLVADRVAIEVEPGKDWIQAVTLGVESILHGAGTSSVDRPVIQAVEPISCERAGTPSVDQPDLIAPHHYLRMIASLARRGPSWISISLFALAVIILTLMPRLFPSTISSPSGIQSWLTAIALVFVGIVIGFLARPAVSR